MSDFLRTMATPISPLFVQITNTAPAAYRPAGEPVAPGAQQQQPLPPNPYLNADGSLTNLAIFQMTIGALSAGVSAYHGYKRNESVFWAVAWGFFGGAFPIVVPAIAFAQGFAKPESK